MKRFLLFLIFCSVAWMVKENDPIIIHLITTNDVHGMIGEQDANYLNPAYPPTIIGGAAFYEYVHSLKENIEDEGLLILDGGNFFQGNTLGMADGGLTMIKWMNKIGYDAIVPGQYDFILGTENLNLLADESHFPFLMSNMSCDHCPLISENITPFVMKDIQGINVGILGILPSNSNEKVLAENRIGMVILHEKSTLEKWIPIMKLSGAELIIILTSTGVPWDREIEYENFIEEIKDNSDRIAQPLNALEMGYFAEGVDIIVSGGNSKGYPKPWYDPHSHTYVMQNYGNGSEFSHMELHIDQETHLFMGMYSVMDGRKGQTLLADNFNSNPEMKEWINHQMAHAKKTALDNVMLEVESSSPRRYIELTDDWLIPQLGTSDNVDIITWNCEFFPKANDSTILALSEAINDLDPDIIAFQEIRKTGWFSGLTEKLPQFEYIVSKQSSFMDMAILYKKNIFKLIQQAEPFADDDYNFAGRSPLQADLQFIDDPENTISVINLHMKCCDSGLDRRKKASEMLHTYIESELQYQSVIVLGDWNDDLKDDLGQHCFTPFLENDRFWFVTEPSTYNDKATYPKEPYVSFLDHIMVSQEFLTRSASHTIHTLRMDNYMGGYDIYETYISDHLPVWFSFPLD